MCDYNDCCPDTGGNSCPESGGGSHITYVNSVVVSPRNITLKANTYFYDFCAYVLPTNATYQNLRWESADPCVASVNPSGNWIYTNGVGTTTIYANATDGSGCYGSLTVTVNNTVQASSVILSTYHLKLNPGQRSIVSATVLPVTATNRRVIWTSSDPCVAEVTNGVITAHAVGSAKIYATAADGSGRRATCSVTVTNSVLVSSICVSAGKTTLLVGSSTRCSETVCPENADMPCVTWSSDDPCVASVSADGIVLALSAGTTIIRASAIDGSGVSGSIRINVTNPVLVREISLSDCSLEMCQGDTHNLSAHIYPQNATKKTLRWHSSDPSIATVGTSNGRVTAIKAGITTISATAQDGSNVTACCQINVMETASQPKEETPEVKNPSEGLFADPVDVYSGAHILKNTAMTLFGGQKLSLTLHYNSIRIVSGVLGAGWYHNYEKRLEINGCEAFVYSSPGVYTKYEADSECYMHYTCKSPDKQGYVLTVDTGACYPYTINCNFDHTEYYDAQGRLAKITDHQGFDTVISYSAYCTTVTDTVSGKSIYIDMDECSGKVIRIRDGANRQTLLTYTGNMLSSIQDPNGKTMSYTYDMYGRVLTGKDAEGVVFFTNTYDEVGRVKTQKDGIANHQVSTFSYDGNKRTTTNRNGKTSVREYNDKGLLVRYTNENGHTKTYEYDNRYNIIRETDECGKSVVKTYNKFNKPTKITNKNGYTTHITYDGAGNIVRILYPELDGECPTETFTYNNRNQLIRHIDRRGTACAFTYDQNGMLASKKLGSRSGTEYSYENGLLKSQRDDMGNVTQYEHNALGQVKTKIDADLSRTSYEYDATGNVLKVTDAYDKCVTYEYDGNNQKKSVTDALGNKTQYSYNGNMKTKSMTLPDSNVISYEYDGEDRNTVITDQDGNKTQMTYDNVGRLLTKQLPDGATHQYEYDAVGNVIKETGPLGAVTIKTYDAMGNVLSVTDDLGHVTRYQYDANAHLVRMSNAAAGTVVYEYSPAGDLLSETDALGHKKTYAYDAYGNRLSVTDARGNVTHYTYDQNNNLLTVTDPFDHTTTYTYNARNQLCAVTDARGKTTTFSYDMLGRRTGVTDARGNTFTTVYDGNGNVIKTTDANGDTVSTTTYNSLNLPATHTDSLGKTFTYTYNKLGKVQTTTDAKGNVKEYGYDACGRNISVNDVLNSILFPPSLQQKHQSSLTYDRMGNVTSLSDPRGSGTTYTYDTLGRLVSESTPSGGTVQYTYNELNVKEQLTNARGQVRKYFHDAAGRITGYVGVEDTVSYTYDANGNVLTVTDSHGTITREYDALNRVTSVTDTYGKVILYEYDNVGNLTKLTYPDGTAVNYTYDGNNNLLSVTDWASRTTTYTYDKNNRVIGVNKPNGSITTTVYDNKQRVTSTVEKTSSGAVISGFEYTYDELSRIVEEKVLDKNIQFCYTYDDLDRVTKRTTKNLSGTVLSQESFTYDKSSNLTQANGTAFTYDAGNRLISYNGNAVSYDLDGNMLSDGSVVYEYDSANRLIKAGGNEYTYNAEDVRIRNLCGEYDTTYVYDTVVKLSRMLQKTTNGITTKYVYGLGLIGEEKECNVFKVYHFDYRGSTVAITDMYGNVTDTFEYDTYGKLVSRTGDSFVIFGYNGRDGVVTDKNGLLYMRARYYNPTLCRFVNADIIHGEISNAVTLNRYAFANGNPVSFVDPFGLAVDDRNSSLSDETIAEIEKILGGVTNLIQVYAAYATIIELIYETSSLYTVSYEKEFPLIKNNSIELNWKTEFSVGNGEINYDISKAIKLLKAKDAKEFWDETDLLKLDIFLLPMEIAIDDYNKLTISLGSKYDLLTNNIILTGSVTHTNSNEFGDYISNTLELKKKISNDTKTNGEKIETEESKKAVSLPDPSEHLSFGGQKTEFKHGGYKSNVTTHTVGGGFGGAFGVCCLIVGLTGACMLMPRLIRA